MVTHEYIGWRIELRHYGVLAARSKGIARVGYLRNRDERDDELLERSKLLLEKVEKAITSSRLLQEHVDPKEEGDV